ncbi:MAG: DMT family transporter [Acidimicrobiia bacterium]|nr:DMT family transporter [Acidimicrobiia bacterium]
MSDERTPSHLGAIGIALFVTVLWSSSWVLIRWGLDGEGLRPISFAALRYGLAALLVIAWMLVREPGAGSTIRHMGRPMILRIVALGVLMYALTQGAQFVAIANQPAATTSLVLSWSPLLVAGLAAVSLSEIPARRQIAGAVLVVVGAWAYFAGNLGFTRVGMAAAFVGLGAGVAASVLGRAINRTRHLSPVIVTALSMTIGSAILVVVGFAAEGVPDVSAKAWLIIVWLAVVNGAFAFTLWNRSLQRLSAVESAGINNTMLIQIAALAWLFLDETPGIAEVAGIALVSIGVFLIQLSGAKIGRGTTGLP